MGRTTPSDMQMERIIRVVRDTIALDPIVTLHSLQRTLEANFNRSFHLEYVKKLRSKAMAQSLYESNHRDVSKRLDQMFEKMRVTSDEIRRIAYWRPDPDQPNERGPNAYTRLLALKAMNELEVAMFAQELLGNKYKLQPGTVEHRHAVVVDPEVREAMFTALKNFKILPDMKAARAIIKKIDNGDFKILPPGNDAGGVGAASGEAAH